MQTLGKGWQTTLGQCHLHIGEALARHLCQTAMLVPHAAQHWHVGITCIQCQCWAQHGTMLVSDVGATPSQCA